MDPIEQLERLANEAKSNYLELAYTYRVYVTHVNHPHSFYVRFEDYNQYMTTVQTRGDPVNKSKINVGAIVIFKSEVAKDYVRGKIIFINEDADITCDLFALDIGYVEKVVPIQNMWNPYYEVDLPALAFHCQLANCYPRTKTWEESTIDAMKGYVLEKSAKIKIKNIMPDAIVAEVCITNPDDLATLLAITRHTSYGYVDDLDYQFTICCNISNDTRSDRTLQVKSVIRVRMQSGAFLDKFFVAQVGDYNTYLEDSVQYTAYADTERPLSVRDLKLNEPIGVYYHSTEKFERAMVREIIYEKAMAKVELIDWGKLIKARVNLMRKLPERFLYNPPIAIYCGLHISQYSMNSLAEISNLSNLSYPGYEFSMRIEEIVDDYNSPNLVTVLDVKL